MIKQKIEQYVCGDKYFEHCGNTSVFEVKSSELANTVTDLITNKNFILKLITASDDRAEQGCFKIWYILALPKENIFLVPFIRLENTEEFPSLTPFVHSAWSYERKIRTFFGLNPAGHPDSRSLILHENWPKKSFPLRKNFNWQERPKMEQGLYKFQKVEGEGMYELPVGPIHAGIIEPGHFRFSLAGEEIMLLEPLLGYAHKGTEKLFEILSFEKTVKLSEKVSGDSSFSHSLAYCQAIESLSDTVVPERALYLRVLYAELERLANHIGDIGAIMLDTGFNFGGAHGARLREEIMQINERLTGSRFLRGVNIVGGVSKDITEEGIKKLSEDLKNILRDFNEVIEVAHGSTSLFNRLKDTGVLSRETVLNHGATGITARCVGIETDARADFPYAVYHRLSSENVEVEHTGDVFARFNIRIKEVHHSVALLKKVLLDIPKGKISSRGKEIKLKTNSSVVSIVEGWRGEIVYFITTDSHGKISRVAPRDPSFVNWTVVGAAGLGNMVPDFPLINKSFNLSYTGNDL